MSLPMNKCKHNTNQQLPSEIHYPSQTVTFIIFNAQCILLSR